MKKVFVKTYGCQMNEYDSDKMVDVLNATQGMEPCDNVEDADVILFNTCSVREKAQEKVFSELGRMKALKAAKPDLVIGVGGCVASQEGATIVSRAPYVDVVFGPQTLHRLPDLIDRRRRTGQSQVDISFPEIEKFDHLPPAKVDGPSAFVSIMEGCSKYCSYCVVPYTRGEEVSRPFEDVLAEVAGLADQGVREVTLLGQNVNAYRGAMGGTTEIADFALLIEYVAEIPGIERIRYTTSHPKEFTSRLVELYARCDKLVNHLHLPVQHASDRILMAMKRGYSALEYKSIIRRLRAIRPTMSMSSDFIVGFPGETDAEFEETLQLVGEVAYAQAFSFKYSPRPGTPAATMDGQVAKEVMDERLQRLQAALNRDQLAFNQNTVGRTCEVLVERKGKLPGQWLGKTPWLQSAWFEGDVQIGDLVQVELVEAGPNSLAGMLRETVAA